MAVGVYQRLSTALGASGAVVDLSRTKQVVSITSKSDTPAARARIAQIIWETVGEEALSDSLEITLNGALLAPDLIDAAYGPTVVHAV